MMHGPEKSDPVIVAGKPTNKAERSAAELAEPRTGTKGNADRQSTHWTQSQARVSQALERIRQAVAVTHPRWEPHAGKPHVRICAGGARQLASLPLKRREFIAGLGSAAAWPLVARGQQQPKVWRIGMLQTISADLDAVNLGAFRQSMRDLGYVEGQNLVIEYRSADGDPKRFPGLVVELIHLNVDLIVTRGTPAVVAAKNATSTIPVVMAATGEALMVVASLARPGGNVTGLSGANPEFEPKRVRIAD